jgi:hypothetical protein
MTKELAFFGTFMPKKGRKNSLAAFFKNSKKAASTKYSK